MRIHIYYILGLTLFVLLLKIVDFEKNLFALQLKILLAFHAFQIHLLSMLPSQILALFDPKSKHLYTFINTGQHVTM